MTNEIFGETMENMRKHRDVKPVTTERKRNFLVSDSNKPVYLGLSILDLSFGIIM